jgi:hypothetical protein
MEAKWALGVKRKGEREKEMHMCCMANIEKGSLRKE